MQIRTALVLSVLTAVALGAEASLIDQGRLAVDRGDPDAAIQLLEKAVAEQPNSSEAYLRLGDAYGLKAGTASIFSAEKNYSAAQAELETASKLDPNFMPIWYHVGRTARSRQRALLARHDPREAGTESGGEARVRDRGQDESDAEVRSRRVEENLLRSSADAFEQRVLVSAAQAQHLAVSQLHLVIPLEQRRERLHRCDIHRRRLVNPRELLVPQLL